MDKGSSQATTNGQVVGATYGPPLFTSGELAGIKVLGRGKGYIEVECGCTSRKFGDFIAKLKVYSNGKLEICCRCLEGCKAENLSPIEFEKHAELKGTSRWKTRIWVFVNDKKTPLYKTKLLKYHKGSASDPSSSIRPRRSRNKHRDEFIRCTICGKDRRFVRRTKEECWNSHQAAIACETWTCSDYPYDKLTCNVKEERSSAKRITRCINNSACEGCTSCMCFGCDMCCFKDCPCRACVDYHMNAEPQEMDSSESE